MLIGISGKMTSGKDTVAKIIDELASEQFETRRFSYKVKKVASELTGWPVELFEDQNFKLQGLGDNWKIFDFVNKNEGSPLYPKYSRDVFEREITVRELLQKIGEGMRAIHEDVWVNALFGEYEPGNKWIIPDVRYLNEFNRVKKEGGIIIRVERIGVPDSQHISETNLDHACFDYKIYNNDTLAELRERVREIMERETGTSKRA
jgi:hypothetical protein